jgi:thiol-disulfide isomerase/thioredoxin
VKKPKVLLGVVLALAAVVGLYLLNRYWIAPATQRAAKAPGARPMAPNFSLTDLDGRKIELAELKGKVVLIDFWATWCGPCRIEIPGFVELQNRYRDEGLVVIGVSLDDSVEPVKDFYREFKMNYPVAMGDGKVTELFGGILGLPTTFLVGRDGRIYSKHTGLTAKQVFEEEIQELLAAGIEEQADFHAAQGAKSEPVELGDPAEINSEIPGVNISKLTAVQVTAFKEHLKAQPCTCGCNMDLLECRLKDSTCGVSRKLAKEQLEKFLQDRV